MGWAMFPHRIQPPKSSIPSSSLSTLNPTNTTNSSKSTNPIVLGMDYLETERITSLQTFPTIRTLQVLQSIGLVIQNPKPPSPVQEGTVSQIFKHKNLVVFCSLRLPWDPLIDFALTLIFWFPIEKWSNAWICLQTHRVPNDPQHRMSTAFANFINKVAYSVAALCATIFGCV